MADKADAGRARLDWFEIPALDIERAVRFYSTVFDIELRIGEVHPGYPMAMLPANDGVTAGALVQGEGYTPSSEGVIVWLNGGDDLSVVMDRVQAAGGQVLSPKMSLGEHGSAASFQDSEGNRIGLHSRG